MKKIILAVLVLATFISCENDDNLTSPSSTFISVNGDTRIPSLSNTYGYEIKLSSFEFNGSSSEPSGIQFVMDIYDVNRDYIGGIGGIESCVELEIYIDVFKENLTEIENIQTFLTANSKEEKQDKANIFIRFKDESDHRIMSGTALDGQTINIEQKNGEYYVSFNDLNFKSNDGKDFTASARLITN